MANPLEGVGVVEGADAAVVQNVTVASLMEEADEVLRVGTISTGNEMAFPGHSQDAFAMCWQYVRSVLWT
jgi:hypothetical protein